MKGSKWLFNDENVSMGNQAYHHNHPQSETFLKYVKRISFENNNEIITSVVNDILQLKSSSTYLIMKFFIYFDIDEL